MKKRSMMKKFIALTLCLVMAAGLLGGCGGDSGDSTKGDASGSQESTTQSESSEDNAGDEVSSSHLNPAGTYPIIKDGTMEMSVYTLSMPNVTDLETNDFTRYLEELTGVKLTFYTGGSNDWEEKLNLLLQTNDYPDVILGVSPNIERYGVEEGIFIPLDEYLTEENVPNYLKVMEEFDLNVTREIDGKIYSIAGINDCYHCAHARKLWVNTEHLDAMGVKAPTTIEEFYDVCKKFMEYKPDGIAVAGASRGWYSRVQDLLIDPFVFKPIRSQTFISRDDVALNKATGEIECVAVTDEYKEAMKYIKSLYDLGAIYDGNFTQESGQMKTLINQADEPVLFFADGTISDVIDSASNNELYRKYAPIAPLEGPNGVATAWTMPNFGVGSGAFVITDKCKDPEAALRWIDFFFSEIGDLCSQFGPEEGVDWVLNPEGKIGLNEKPALYEVLNIYSAEPQNHDWQDIGIRVATSSHRLGQAVDADVDPYSPEGLEKLLYDASEEFYAPYTDNGSHIQLNGLLVTDEERSSVATIVVEIEKIIEETSVAFMTGAKDIDAEWDNYIDSLEKAGLSKLLEVYTIAYNRTYGK